MPDVLAESSPAPIIDSPALTPAVKSGDFAAFEREQRATPKTPAAESSPAPAVAQPASTDATSKPPSEAASKPDAPPRKGADSRVQELLAERAQLRRELEQAKQPARTTQPASTPAAPAASPETFPDYAEYLMTHPDATLSAYLDERDDFRETRRANEAAQREAATARERSFTEQARDLKRQFDEVQQTDPDFESKLDPEVLETNSVAKARALGERVTPANIVTSELLQSSMAPQLSRYFSDHKDEWTRLQEVPERFRAMPPPLAAHAHVEWIKREIGRIEGKLDATRDAPAAPPIKHVTSAPPPASTLGTRPAAPVDAEADAIKRGDYSAVERIWRAKDAAASGRSR